MSTPFALLIELDQRCRDNAKGLPAGAKVEEDWIGIGFGILGQRLIAKMADVTEILPPPKTIRIPGVQPWVKGLANIRGTLLPILDMSAFLEGSKTKLGKESRVLIINKDNVVAGLLVEEVFGLRRFKPDARKQKDHLENGSMTPYLDGMFSDDQLQWDIFSVEKLVNHEQFLKVA